MLARVPSLYDLFDHRAATSGLLSCRLGEPRRANLPGSRAGDVRIARSKAVRKTGRSCRSKWKLLGGVSCVYPSAVQALGHGAVPLVVQPRNQRIGRFRSVPSRAASRRAEHDEQRLYQHARNEALGASILIERDG